MKRTAIIAAVIGTVGLGVGGVALADQDADRNASGRDDHARFEQLQRQQYDAWHQEDGAAFAATFTENADMVTFNGDHLSTRARIATGMQYYFDNYIGRTTLRELDEHVRYVTPNHVVIVRTTCILNEGESDCRPDSSSTNTNVLVKRHGTWLQDSFQNTRKFDLP
jgi:uncharacterized protein (TIGR02246 family)